MTVVVDDMIDSLVGREGKYSNDPNDPGGETMWGITEHIARAYGYTGNMAELPRETAVIIYKQRFWFIPRISAISVIDNAIGTKLFDIGVNMGPITGIQFMQRALNALNQQQKAYPDITVDGTYGPVTARCFSLFIGKRGALGRKTLLFMIAAQQSVRYIELAEKKQSNEEYEFGWEANRALFMIS